MVQVHFRTVELQVTCFKGRDEVKIEVEDSITGLRMTDPVRGNECLHNQRLDRSTYDGRDRCPVCNKPFTVLKVVFTRNDVQQSLIPDGWLKEKIREVPQQHYILYFPNGDF